ncbi:MAG: NAD(P)-binding domain-containing protein [Ginsengibacter sp.]
MLGKKTIAIVGATEIKGMEIAFLFTENGYRLLLISNNTEKLSHLSESITAGSPNTEIDTLECVKDGCWEADVIILAVTCSEEYLVAGLIKEVATQKIVVSVSNERNLHEDLQQILPYSRLVKIIFIPDSKEIIIKGNDEEANEEISEIFKHAGYSSTISN